MAINFYQILEANEAASQETLQALFEQKSERLKCDLEDGSPTAKEQLWFLRQAYETLVNPAKRAAYDETLKPKPHAAFISHPAETKATGLSWQTNAVLLLLLASGLIGFGMYLTREGKKDDHVAQVLQTNRSADNDATRADTERVLVEGTVNNNSKIIDRSMNIQQDAENRRRQEMEYRASTTAEVLRLEQERLKIADEQIKWQRKQQEDAQRAEQEQQRRAMATIEEIRRNATKP